MSESDAGRSARQLLAARILERFAVVDWRAAAEREAVYGLISTTITRMRTHASHGASATVLATAYEDVVRAIEARVEGCESLHDLRKSMDVAQAGDWTILTGRADPVAPPRGGHERSRQPPSITGIPGAPGPTGQGQGKMRLVPTDAAPSRYTYLTAAMTLFLLSLATGYSLYLGLRSKVERARVCDAISVECFDTGWQPVSSKITTTYFYRHSLGAAPRTIQIWFSAKSSGENAFPLVWKFPRSETGNPVSIEVRPNMVLLNIWSGVPLFGAYDSTKDLWTTYTDGFYRIVAEK